MQLGNPSGATSDPNNTNHFLIVRTIEALDYNNTLGEANWASWDLTSNDCNSVVARQNSFAPDTNGLPASFHIVGANDYSHSGYDRGHLCPAEDRSDTTNNNNLTFLMDNMMPQAPDNNEVTWSGFEAYCRAQVQSTNKYEMLIICGPSGFNGAKINTNGYVAIPQYTWKVAVVLPFGNTPATNRITTTNRVIAIKVPNTNGVSSSWQNFITSAAQIEVDTGLTFFTALPPAVAAALRAKVDGQTNPPPGILSFSPTNGAAGTNVVITGTNFNSVVAVTFNGTSANYTVNSSNQITAVVPTNAGSGFISVTTSSGTAVSANSFTVTGSNAVVVTAYGGLLAGWDTSGIPTGVAGNAANYGPSPLAPSTNGPNLAVVGLTRGGGVTQSGGGASRGWGGTGFTSLTSASAIGAGQFVSFSLTASNGYKLSCSAIDKWDYRRSGSGATNGLLQYQVGNGVFTDITNIFYSTITTGGGSLPGIDLSGIASLQNVPAGTNVTFRIVNWGGTSSAGTWYVFDVAGSSAPDFSVQGTITPVSPPTPPGFQSFSWAGGNASLTITGTVASSFTILATTNLASPNWTTLLTTNPGSLPFTFVDASPMRQRFYRVQNP